MTKAGTRRVRRSDLVFAGAARVVAAGLSAVWVFAAARFLPVDEFAAFALCVALSVVFVALADLGVATVMASAMAEEPSSGRQILRAAISLRLRAAVIVVPAFLVAFGLSSPAPLWPAVVMSVSVVATLVHSTCAMALRVVGRARTEAGWDVGVRLLVLGVGSLWLSQGGGLAAATAMYALADVVTLLALGRVTARSLESDPHARPVAAFRVRGFALIALAFSLATVYYRADLWLLGVLRDPTEVAMYAAAYKLFDAVLLPSLTLSGFVVPMIGRAREHSAFVTTRRLVLAGLGITVPGAIAVAVLAPFALELGFGSEYRSADTALRVLMLAALPSAAVFVLGQAVAVIDSLRFASILCVCFVANTVLNLALIPSHGYLVAAWTTLACQLVLAGGWWWAIVRRGRELSAEGPTGSAGGDEVAVPERAEAAAVQLVNHG